MCNESINIHPSTIQFVPECYKTQEMCHKALKNIFRIWFYECNAQEMCEKVISENPVLIVYWPDKYKTQRTCDEAVDDCLAALRFIPDCFFTNKMLEKFDSALHTNDDILFYNDDFDKVKFIANQRNIFAVDFDKINLDNDNNLKMIFFSCQTFGLV